MQTFHYSISGSPAKAGNWCLAEGSQPKCILLVDDDPEFRALEADILSKEGYAVLQAGSVSEAMSIAGSVPSVHLLVADFWFPSNQGSELTRRFHELYPEAAVLMISGSLPAGAWTGEHSGEHPILSRPFTFLELARRVRIALDSPP